MNSLKVIQTLAKIGKILSFIVFVCSMIGVAACGIGIFVLALVGRIPVGDLDLIALIEENAGQTIGAIYASMAIGIVFGISEIVLSRLARRYFKHEIEAGTPFTVEGSRELMRLGIVGLVVSVVTSIVAGIVILILSHTFVGVESLDFKNEISISLYVVFIVVSVLCRYGAEIKDGKSE